MSLQCLDEGCNSTCHSKAWAVDAEARLARLGYSMPLKDDGCKSFAGLGSGSTKTEGVRSIPFSLLLPDGNMNGELDSYQLSTGNSPLLLSLHAQTKLGLVKDLAKGVVSIKGQPLNIKRYSKSGLLVMNLTEGLTNIINTPPNELPQIQSVTESTTSHTQHPHQKLPWPTMTCVVFIRGTMTSCRRS